MLSRRGKSRSEENCEGKRTPLGENSILVQQLNKAPTEGGTHNHKPYALIVQFHMLYMLPVRAKLSFYGKIMLQLN